MAITTNDIAIDASVKGLEVQVSCLRAVDFACSKDQAAHCMESPDLKEVAVSPNGTNLYPPLDTS